VTFDVEQNKAADDLSYDEASWLLTNKQMLHEGIQQLHQKFLMALQEQRRDYEVPVLHLSPDDSYTGANA
jgi:penicillin V acylase-like amidase (Ntn superfamily)